MILLAVFVSVYVVSYRAPAYKVLELIEKHPIFPQKPLISASSKHHNIQKLVQYFQKIREDIHHPHQSYSTQISMDNQNTHISTSKNLRIHDSAPWDTQQSFSFRQNTMKQTIQQPIQTSLNDYGFTTIIPRDTASLHKSISTPTMPNSLAISEEQYIYLCHNCFLQLDSASNNISLHEFTHSTSKKDRQDKSKNNGCGCYWEEIMSFFLFPMTLFIYYLAKTCSLIRPTDELFDMSIMDRKLDKSYGIDRLNGEGSVLKDNSNDNDNDNSETDSDIDIETGGDSESESSCDRGRDSEQELGLDLEYRSYMDIRKEIKSRNEGINENKDRKSGLLTQQFSFASLKNHTDGNIIPPQKSHQNKSNQKDKSNDRIHSFSQYCRCTTPSIEKIDAPTLEYYILTLGSLRPQRWNYYSHLYNSTVVAEERIYQQGGISYPNFEDADDQTPQYSINSEHFGHLDGQNIPKNPHFHNPYKLLRSPFQLHFENSLSPIGVPIRADNYRRIHPGDSGLEVRTLSGNNWEQRHWGENQDSKLEFPMNPAIYPICSLYSDQTSRTINQDISQTLPSSFTTHQHSNYNKNQHYLNQCSPLRHSDLTNNLDKISAPFIPSSMQYKAPYHIHQHVLDEQEKTYQQCVTIIEDTTENQELYKNF